VTQTKARPRGFFTSLSPANSAVGCQPSTLNQRGHY